MNFLIIASIFLHFSENFFNLTHRINEVVSLNVIEAVLRVLIIIMSRYAKLIKSIAKNKLKKVLQNTA